MTKSSTRAATGKSKPRLKSNDRWPIVIVAGMTAIVLIVIATQFAPRTSNLLLVDGVVLYNNLPGQHSEAPQVYPQNPPVGGIHSATWQNCGIYDQPVRSENAVHSLEHGAVWITYQPDLLADQVEQIRAVARGKPYLLVSPYPGLPKPVVASAWGVQLPLENASDPRLTLFAVRYAGGPQTPEPGATCEGGIGTPIG